MQLSLVIVTWRSVEVVTNCLRSLRENPPSLPHEVIVVDNGSGDGTLNAVRRELPEATIVANRHNRGLAAANNQGMLAAVGEWLLICNPDIEFRPGAIDALLDCARRRPRAAFVIPKLLHPDGSLQPGTGDLPTLREALAGRQGAHNRAVTSGFWWDAWAHDEERRIGHGAEAAYLVRRSAVAQIGLQDENYRLDWEGIEWAARAADAGWEVWFCPGAEIVHVGGASLRQAPLRWVIGSHRGVYRYFSKRVAPPVRPLLAAVVATRAAVKLAGLAARQPLYDAAQPRSAGAARGGRRR